MGFLDLSAAARETYFHQNEDCLIPGYTGHCPMLKFRFGKPYGANTKDILKLRECASPGSRALHRYGEPHFPNEFPLRRVHSEEPGGLRSRAPQLASQRARPFVLGYTGFIPGMTFRFGTSFGRAADAALALMHARSAEQAGRRAREARDVHAHPPPPQLSIRGRDVVPEAIAQPDAFAEDRYKDSHISAALPPIAGYTGHIPRLKGTEASLSQRYHTAVTRGLRMLEQEQLSYRGSASGTPRATSRALPYNAAQP